MGEGSRLDDLARDLASGTISRRTALRRLAAGAIGIGLAATPSALAEELERGRCPKRRRCGKRCCPKGKKCKNGRCRCKAGTFKCGKGCCPDGELCDDGVCVSAICGDGVRNGTEDCDGADMGAETCESLGFTGGTLACSSTCTYDTSGCSSAECTSGQTRPCYSGPAGTGGVGICQGGTQTCTAGTWGACVGEVLPQAETCNGLDDNCNGVVDDGLGGDACETGSGPGVTACVDGSIVCQGP
jgi:Notch-like protein